MSMKAKIRKAERALEKHQAAARQCPYRPQYHFLPPANWMNDPNGTLFHNGEYHLFYQLNPYRPRWGRIHWGHARSVDLLHWEHLPIALAPGPGLRELHCFSGCCAIAADGRPTIFYTSISAKSFATKVTRFAEQWSAAGDAELIAWEKLPQNPVLSEAQHHPHENIRNWRDPYLWKEQNRWWMVIAGQEKGEKFGSVYLYQSADLARWETVGRLHQGNPSLGRTWECPNYFRLGDKRVLVVSPFRQVIYSVGEFRDQRHHAEDWHILDHGKSFYATNTFMDDKERVVMVGWVKAKGKGRWAGCLSLPREVRLDSQNRLITAPIPELKSLRNKHQHLERSLDGSVALAGSAPYFGECVEVQARFNLDRAEAIGFDLIDDDETYKIRLDFASNTLQVAGEQATLQFPLQPQQVDLHLFIDQCVIEVFLNGRETFTTVFYPQLGENNALKIAPFFVRAQGKVQIDFWTLRGIFPKEA